MGPYIGPYLLPYLAALFCTMGCPIQFYAQQSTYHLASDVALLEVEAAATGAAAADFAAEVGNRKISQPTWAAHTAE